MIRTSCLLASTCFVFLRACDVSASSCTTSQLNNGYYSVGDQHWVQFIHCLLIVSIRHFKPEFRFIFAFRLYTVLAWIILLILGSNAVHCLPSRHLESEIRVHIILVVHQLWCRLLLRSRSGHYCSGGDKFACPAGTSNSLAGSMHSFACTICPAGSVSGTGGSQCNECPAGTYETGDSTFCSECTERTYQPNFGQNQCITAAPGHYVPTKRSNTQTPCDAGSAQPLSGQVSSKLNLGRCLVANVALDSIPVVNAALSRGTSHPGSTSANACMAGSSPQPVKTCTQPNNDICPAVIAKTPSKRSPSQLHADSCSISVPRRHWCKVLNGGMECVDTMNDLEMCGGCLEPGHAEDLTTGARDCSAIEGVGNVQCKQGKCEIGSCRKGLRVATDGRTCVRVKLADIHKRLSHGSTGKGWAVSS
ncbi:hypothetical protein EV359DRAFT_61328 [Lentinula novae-zelandiae]|nr:hypothetical protein EV359DRAFT_61328 [Lentinula novae-zelandiae]